MSILLGGNAGSLVIEKSTLTESDSCCVVQLIQRVGREPRAAWNRGFVAVDHRHPGAVLRKQLRGRSIPILGPLVKRVVQRILE
jgi:hypothetical protein